MSALRYGLEASITLYREPNERDNAAAARQSGGAGGDQAGPRPKTNPYKLNEEELTLTRSIDGKTFRVFQELQVRIFVQESAQRRQWLVIELADEPTTQYFPDKNRRNDTAKLPSFAPERSAAANASPAAASPADVDTAMPQGGVVMAGGSSIIGSSAHKRRTDLQGRHSSHKKKLKNKH